MKNLKTGQLTLPDRRVRQSAGTDPVRLVKEAFELGYTALDHRIRNGENTVSWYRGPFTPLSYLKLETYTHLPSADAALRYDYDTGLLDASYAAAWQLGRLLALQNTHFAKSLYRYRNQERRKTKTWLREVELQKEYALPAKPVEDEIVETLRKVPANA
jgi:hypothetical protein